MNGSLYQECQEVRSVSDLDIASLISKLDTEDMLGYLRNFPDDFAKQMDIFQEKGRTPNSTLCLGMGGSGPTPCLYNLDDDPTQMKDLAQAHPEQEQD